MRIQIFKLGKGWLPTGDDAAKVHARMSPGEVAWVKILRIRDPAAHGRYWALMTMCAENCEQIELPMGGVMPVHTKDDVHAAMKLCTGHYDTIFDAEQRPVAYLPKSTNFESMTADEWSEYWPRVTQAVCTHILPGVRIPEIEHELLRCAGLAA